MTCVTVHTITRRSPVQVQWSRRTIILTSIAIWTFPIVTSECRIIHILYLHSLDVPSVYRFYRLGDELVWPCIRQLVRESIAFGGIISYGCINRCWLVEKPVYMRYVLTHIWRFLFIFLEIGLYTYLVRLSTHIITTRGFLTYG
jgi:hypothetical protein